MLLAVYHDTFESLENIREGNLELPQGAWVIHASLILSVQNCHVYHKSIMHAKGGLRAVAHSDVSQNPRYCGVGCL